ncbi:hypothetical protein Mp_2g16430 [Marchantia polymorpha subsp. ruderalis]|uniref:Phospholipase D C-terminal domain-containing protein n=1 Tax=Marchantia polymorpha TaxID=3197 RepID=A0A2R6W9R5_MARPO|nr:hypothetical protein MARPO_0122s0021 [Marchantia polymorpha]BBN02579.1 hypothetical protein Mp_2g16430 [Marchantia polymorpha subsp. ruderalis]|eukprot:PTQ30590.1 hypothetical protein MARPO_0122s0021 [Marchantia polymorpha]
MRILLLLLHRLDLREPQFNKDDNLNWWRKKKEFLEKLLRRLSRTMFQCPVAVTHEGDVTELPGMTCFPDTKAPILGALQEAMPPILTT